jgi:hypothetical protein
MLEADAKATELHIHFQPATSSPASSRIPQRYTPRRPDPPAHTQQPPFRKPFIKGLPPHRSNPSNGVPRPQPSSSGPHLAPTGKLTHRPPQPPNTYQAQGHRTPSSRGRGQPFRQQAPHPTYTPQPAGRGRASSTHTRRSD